MKANPIDNASLSNANAINCSKALWAELIAKCEGNAVGIVTLIPRRHGLEAWRLLKKEYEGKQGSGIAAMLRGILSPIVKWQQGHSEGNDLIEAVTAWERDVSKYYL